VTQDNAISESEVFDSLDDSVEQTRDGASSLTKMLSILDLFTAEKPIWSTNDLIVALETSRSTGYRYIKTLNASDLLSAVGNGYYVLGPRIIELDLQIRNTDPLLQSSKGILDQLVEATGHSALLCMLYRNSVLCINEKLAPLSPENLFSRGQKRPLLKGAVSKVILAYLPNHQLRNLYSRSSALITDANLGATWPEFRDTLGRIRKEGYTITKGEFNPGVFGVAAPVFNSDDLILGSIGVSWSEHENRDVDLKRIVMSVKRAAHTVSQRLSQSKNGMDLPPRAVG
jgi:DNA-binding IclR family transcriptional regulator